MVIHDLFDELENTLVQESLFSKGKQIAQSSQPSQPLEITKSLAAKRVAEIRAQPPLSKRSKA